jgi:chromosome segregation ATPase
MARPGVTYSEVAQAARALAEAGHNPTVDLVRARLGTGSKSTLAPLLKRWKTQHAATVAESETGLPQDLVTAVKGLYGHLQAQAQAEISAGKDAARREVETAQASQRVAEGRQKALEDALAQRTAAQTQLEEKVQTLEMALEAAERARLTLQTQVDGLRQQLEDRSQALHTLQHHLAQAQTNLEHYRDAVRQQRAEEGAVWERQIRQLEAALSAQREDNQALRTSRGRLEREQARLEAAQAQGQAEKTALAEQGKHLSQRLEQTRQRLAEVRGRYHALAKAHQDLIAKQAAQDEERLAQARTTAALHAERDALAAALRKAEAALAQLQEAHRLLAQEKAQL